MPNFFEFRPVLGYNLYLMSRQKERSPAGLSRRFLLSRVGRVGAVLSLAQNFPVYSPFAVDGVNAVSAEIFDRAGMAMRGESLAFDGQKRQLGERLKNWKLPNGANVPQLFPEVLSAARVYTEDTLDNFFPGARGLSSRLIYSSNMVGGEAEIDFRFQVKSPLKITASSENIKPFDMYPVKYKRINIRLENVLRDKEIEKVVAAKEALQIVDFVEFAKVYVNLQKRYGAKYELKSARGINVSWDEVLLAVALGQNSISASRGEKSWFHLFVDTVSGFRTACLFGNWLKYYPFEANAMSGKFMQAGHNSAGFLQQEGLLAEKNGVFVWAGGKAPEVDSQETLRLFSKFTGALI